MIVEFLLIFVVGCLSSVAGYVFSKRFRQSAVPLVILGFSLLGLSVLPRLYPSGFYFLFPSQFYLEVVLAAAFFVVGALAAFYSDSLFRIILQSILLLLMGFFILFPTGYLALNARYIRDLDYKVVDGVTLQSSNFGCVPSSIATIMRWYGLEYTEGDLAYALRTTVLGTDYSRIPRVVHDFGKQHRLSVKFIRTDLRELKRLNKPAILFGYSGRIRHATALLGFEGDKVILGEPLQGLLRIPESEFQARTQWTNLAAVVAKELD
jgi:predicted double-glycine peptidase